MNTVSAATSGVLSTMVAVNSSCVGWQKSTLQLLGQKSSLTRLPSSHVSGGVIVPLPHTVQALVQPSESSAFPSSHCSPGSVTPLLLQDRGRVVVVVLLVVVVGPSVVLVVDVVVVVAGP